MPSKVSPRDVGLYVDFRAQHGRDPKSPADGPAYWAMLRGRAANLAAQATTPKQEWESDSTFAWRRRTALKGLVRTAKQSRAARRIMKRLTVPARPREGHDRRRRGDATSRTGDSGDRPPPPDLDPVDDGALRRGGAR
jgi:hypothetical protein